MIASATGTFKTLVIREGGEREIAVGFVRLYLGAALSVQLYYWRALRGCGRSCI